MTKSTDKSIKVVNHAQNSLIALIDKDIKDWKRLVPHRIVIPPKNNRK